MARDIYEDHDDTQAPKEGLGNALVYITFLMLALAVFMAQKALKDQYNAGMLADKSQPLVGGN
ncbi:MAG: hypothetical protein R3F05_11635 [Planctomycetota bacterium]|nr:hypothetical protein [Planctomycetota bacterium]MCB9902308.1 hypothetical protein [Planctomycetota bacterium]